MPSKKIVSVSEARERFFALVDEVQQPGNFCTLTVGDAPRAVLIAKKEFDLLMETIELLSRPELVADIKKIEEEYARGDYFTWEQVKQRIGLRPLKPGAKPSGPRRKSKI